MGVTISKKTRKALGFGYRNAIDYTGGDALKGAEIVVLPYLFGNWEPTGDDFRPVLLFYCYILVVFNL